MDRSSLLQLIQEQLDPENTGFIGADTFTGLVHSHELPLDPAKLDMLVALAQSNEQGQVCYQELVDLVSATVGGQLGRGPGLDRHGALAGVGWAGSCSSLPFLLGRAGDVGQALRPCEDLGGPLRQGGSGGSTAAYARAPPPQISSKRSSSFKRAIANGQRALPRDGLLDEPGLGVYKRFVRYVAYEILPREVDRHWYFYRHRSCPPPVFMASVTLAQIIVFLCYGARLNKWVLQTYHPEYMKSPLVYHPGHRARAWRFLTYMFMHVGLEQLGFNALLQLMIGVPLEMVHGLLRISLLYLAGVLAELGWDAVSLQAAEDGAGPGVHELRGGPGRMAAFLPTTACLRPTAQLHGAPGGRGGGCQHGPDHPAQLRGAPSRPVWLVGGAACLWHFPALRHLLERLCLRPAGGPHPPPTMTGPPGPRRPGCSIHGPATRQACMSTLCECTSRGCCFPVGAGGPCGPWSPDQALHQP
ncbi:rhomboid-related protein 1 isoform X2 [Sus scrofa]|uniref:rhomboid-related protein 1 isoform X2 n=1 Tax=Sus scrofa TaxID=9823 RepID=UPI000A2B2A33|nr:rhomboid-related protein 1 isoform X2 [Sus scrofa]